MADITNDRSRVIYNNEGQAIFGGSNAVIWVNPAAGSHAGVNFRQDGTFKGFVGFNNSSSCVNLSMDGSIADGINVNASHNVGIGTTSQAVKLDVSSGGSDSVARFTSTDSNARILIADNADTMYVGTQSNKFYIGANDSATSGNLIIDSSGNVGIGTSSPGNLLDVAGDTDITGQLVVSHDANYVAKFVNTATSMSNNNYTLMVDSSAHTSNMSTAGAMSVDVNSGRAFTITGQGKIGIGTTSPGGSLHVVGPTGSSGDIYVSDADNGTGTADGLLITKSGTNAFVYNRDGGQMSFGTNDVSNNLVIANTGNVGIGLTSPGRKLTVSADIGVGNGNKLFLWNDHDSNFLQYNLWQASASGGMTIKNIASGGDIIFQTVSNTALTIDSSQNSTFAGDVTVTGGDSVAPQINLLHDGANPGTHEELGVVQFQVDYDGAHQNWGKIRLDTNNSSVRTNMEFYVKSTSGAEQVALTLEGQPSAVPNAIFAGDVQINGSLTGAGSFVPVGGGTFTGDVTFQGGEGAVQIIGSGNQDIKVGSTSGGYARIYLDGSNGDFSGSDYIYIGQDDDKSVHFYADSNAGTTTFTSKGSTNLVMDGANSYFAGNLGIGNTNPGNRLRVDAAAGQATTLSNSITNAAVYINSDTGNGSNNIRIGESGSGSYFLQASNSAGTTPYAINLNPFGGNVGIGTASPAQKLEVAGVGRFTGSFGIEIDTPGGGPIITFGSTSDYDSFGSIGHQASQYQFVTQSRPFNFLNGSTSRMFIDNSGNVGIGTTSANQSGFSSDSRVATVKAPVSGGAAVLELIGLGNSDNNTVGVLNFMSQSGGTALSSIKGLRHTSDTSGKLRFDTAGSERMRITETGRVGIGTDSPSDLLSLATASGDCVIGLTGNSGGDPEIHMDSGNNRSGNIKYGDGSTAAMFRYQHSDVAFKFYAHNQTDVDFQIGENTSFFASCNLGIGNTSPSQKLHVTGSILASSDVVAFSDKKLKENIKTLDGSKVYDMRGVSFTRKDIGKDGSGVIAQEIQKIAPELVTDNDGTLSVAYGNLTGYLIEAVKELKTEVEQLKKQIKNGNNL